MPLKDSNSLFLSDMKTFRALKRAENNCQSRKPNPKRVDNSIIVSEPNGIKPKKILYEGLYD